MPRKIREPRNREKFIDAAVAADRLEGLAKSLRDRRPGDVVRWEAKCWYWNDTWNDNPPATGVVVTQAAFNSGPDEKP